MQQEHAVVPHRISDRRTRFVVGGTVGQLVVGTKCLVVVPCSNASREIHFFPDNVLPECINGPNVGGLSGEGRDIGHPAIHVGRSHCVSHRFGLLGDRLVVLAVFAIDAVFFATLGHAPVVEEEFCQVQVPLLSGSAIEFDETDLNLLMTGDIDLLALAFSKQTIDEICIFDRHVEQGPFSGRLIVGHRRFVEMSHVVELVAVFQMGPAVFSGVPLLAKGFLSVDGADCKEIAVVLLCGCNLCDQFVEIFFQNRVGMERQRIGCPFNDLKDI